MRVREVMNNYFYPVKIDIESQHKLTYNGREMTEQEFGRNMRVAGTPTFFFIDHKGEVIGAQPGFIPKKVYIHLLSYIETGAYRKMEFSQYMGNR